MPHLLEGLLEPCVYNILQSFIIRNILQNACFAIQIKGVFLHYQKLLLINRLWTIGMQNVHTE